MNARFIVAMALVVTMPAWGAPKVAINAVEAVQHAGATTEQAQPGMQAMMQMHEQMMAEMKADRAKLDALTKEMNNAVGSQKVDAIAAVVSELVRQQNAMYERMGQMHGQMMSGRGMMGGRNMRGH
jgi:hypothetical protein